MQFQVPQFIEVEDKIIGPLTFKQFVFVGGGLGMAYLFWRVLPIYVAAPLIISSGGLAAALAFFQINGRPFILAVESGFFYLLHPKLYLWNNQRPKDIAVKKAAEPSRGGAAPYVPRLSESRLHELAWSLDIQERIAAGTADERDRETENLVTGLKIPASVVAHLKAR